MQPQNQLNYRNLMLVLAAASVIIILVIVGSIVIQHRDNTNGSAGSSDSTTSTVATPTPPPSNPDAASTQPAFTNFDALTDDGFTSDQLEDLKFALTKYDKQLPKYVSEIVLDTNTVRNAPLNPNSDTTGTTMYFSVAFGSQGAYQVTANLSSPTAGQFTLVSPQGAHVFDSGLIDLYNGVGD